MPNKPKRPCSYPGCPKLTDGRFCEEHAKAEAKRYEKYDRDPAVHRRYGRAWKRIRDSYVEAHPLCELCLKEQRYVKTEEIHHIKPLSEGGTHARENLIALCKPCHARIHAQRGDRWHNHCPPRGGSNLYNLSSGERAWGHVWKIAKVFTGIAPTRKKV